MAQQIFNITGTYNLAADPNWKNLPVQEIRLECDTTAAPVIINLFAISALAGFYNVKIFVIDKAGNAATNNITINAAGGNTIDGNASVVLNSNGAATEIQIVTNTQMISFESTAIGSAGVPQSFMVVDATYGDDATASPNNASKPYRSVGAAIDAAAVGALIVLNPGTYSTFSNVLKKSLSYNLRKGASFVLGGGGTCSEAGQSFRFFGEGDLTLNANLTLDTAFNGYLKIDVNTLTLNAYLYIDNSGYYGAAPTAPTQVILKAREVVNNTVLAAIYASIVSMNVDFGTYRSSNTAGTADFWCFGGYVPTFDINSYINIGSATMTPAVNPGPFLRLVGASSRYKTVVTGSYNYSNLFNASRPTLINVDTTTQTVFFNGYANLTNASMLLDQGTAQVNIKGKVINNDTAALVSSLFNCYNIGGSTVQIEADTTYDSPNNACVAFGAGGSLTLYNNATQNTNGAPAKATVVITGGGIVRCIAARVINAVTSLSSPGAITIQAYSLFTNTAPVNVSSVFGAAAPIITDVNVTADHF